MASAAIMDAFIRKGLLGLFLVLLPVISSADEDPIAIIGKMKGDYTFSPPAAARFFPSSQKDKAGDILMNAMGMLGIAYKWGGDTPQNGMDCSGFVRYVFKTTANIDLPHIAREMAKEGVSVARSDLRPGDLVFFATHRRRVVSHVGIYIGGNKFIHTPRTGKTVEIRPLDNSYWTKAYLGARRIQ